MEHDDDKTKANSRSFLYLTSLTKSESLLLARDAANDGHSPQAEVAAELDCLLLDLLCQLPRRRKNYSIRTQLRIFEPSSSQSNFGI